MLVLDQIPAASCVTADKVIRGKCSNDGGNACLQQKLLRNATGFQAFSTALRSKTWNKGAYTAIVMQTATGEELLFAYTFNL